MMDRTLLLCLVVLVTPFHAAAQSDGRFCALQVKLLGKSVGVRVSVNPESSGEPPQVKLADSDIVAFCDLDAGSYEIKAESPGAYPVSVHGFSPKFPISQTVSVVLTGTSARLHVDVIDPDRSGFPSCYYLVRLRDENHHVISKVLVDGSARNADEFGRITLYYDGKETKVITAGDSSGRSATVTCPGGIQNFATITLTLARPKE